MWQNMLAVRTVRLFAETVEAAELFKNSYNNPKSLLNLECK
jgi:hypothetical protein